MALAGSRCALVIFTILLMTAVASGAKLSKYFYYRTCPNVESIVRNKVNQIVTADRGMAPGLLRLHFHDCFVRGCDGSVLLDSASHTAEKDAPPNFGSLRGFAEVDAIKATVESACPGVVSCADILALAARDAVVKVGGKYWSVPLGRKDGFTSSLVEANASLPSPFSTFSQLVQNFAAVGLNAKDMVILSGGHTIGQAHCAVVIPRLYNFNGVPGATDPSLDPTFANLLRTLCPSDQPLTFVGQMDATNGTFDNKYFKAVQSRRGLFPSDAALITNSFGRRVVSIAAKNPGSFSTDFGKSMVKMGNIRVLTGAAGEVRRVCSAVNNNQAL
ncbi:peroxidase [Marchantia polymorpha subsp. ruderalis]|uniref:Peroxidase n=2 Tax=Marchantia polymorpha TaxID=3197 RepID=A0AAF6B184_MARPO|nr:hypothetical protein MARPO_0004s0092 [Marchantia polymorpha]BBN05768.1 hypothetical protein Mp_3g15800 [Marchantia polymorpha subsp. ruderalis]|eukprot:PTQ48811.1 hypothetical protein MARPO_0004s0092 [Marchantia polymorpha]